MPTDDLEDFAGGGLPDFLRDPLGAIRRHWVWMLVTLLLGFGATGVFVYLQHPVYSSTATVLVTSQQIREDLVRSTVREDSFQRISALMNSLLSMSTLSSLIEQFDLYPDLQSSMTLAEISGRMRTKIKIEPRQGIGGSIHDSARMYSISFEHPQAEQAADVANALAGRFTDESIRMRTQQASLATGFLRSELDRADKALRGQNTEIREFKERNRGELPGDLRTNLMKLDRLQQQRQSLALQITEAENRRVLQSRGSGVFDSATPEQRLIALRSKLQVELEKYTDEHPSIVQLRFTIDRAAAAMAASPDPEEVKPISVRPESATLEIVGFRKQLRATEDALEKLDEQVTRTPARQEELSALESRNTVLRENYLSFLRKVQEAELAQSLEQAQQGARFSIAERAQPARNPTKARLMFLMVGVTASLVLAVGVGLLLEALDPVLVSKTQIEALSPLRVLGSAPRLG